ncbi:MAG: hypothetical protein PHN18_07455 [Sulfurospirillaceae bacterium]|jgi:hypothetical protein|nr:hypothetical protein [Sulfurospirillaceae bacterium]MDD2827227.1 hypothetical protein [Sulfurospirillaceae bacterium]
MKSWYHLVDLSIGKYVQQEIENEIHKDIEDLIFFSSYTISLEVFKDATLKLRELLKKEIDEIDIAAQEEIKVFLRHYHLDPRLTRKKQRYIARELINAHVRINEALIKHYYNLYHKAHSFDYLESRADEIYQLLKDDEPMDEM